MSDKQEIQFVVIKQNHSFETCSDCKGRKTRTRRFRKMTFVEDCPTCNGEGLERITTTEEVPLAEAMKTIQSIKNNSEGLPFIKALLNYTKENQS